MPKLPNVTNAEIVVCNQCADQLLNDLHDYADRIEKGYVERIEDPLTLAREFTIVARAASDMAVKLFWLYQIQETKDEAARLKEELARTRA